MYSLQELTELEKVLKYHIECIYKSGLLLDEHDELLQELLRLPQIPKPKLEILPLASILCGLCLTLRMKSSLSLIMSSIPLGVKILNGFITKRRCRIYNRNFNGLITSFQKVFQLNKCIIQYYHKKKVSLTKVDHSTRMLIEAPVILKLSEFLQNATTSMWEIVLHIKKQLSAIKEMFNIKEFASVYELNIPEDIRTCNTEEEIITNLETVQMCVVFAVSTLLCAIGFSFSHIELKNKKHLSLFSTIIPNCHTFTEDVYQKLSNNYERISYRLPSIEITINKPKHTDNIHLQSGLNTLNENLKLSFDTVTALQLKHHTGLDLDLSQFKHQLNDLDKLLAECVNTLTYLRFETKKTQNSDSEIQVCLRNSSEMEEENLQVIRYDDTEVLALNEEYSLSIHGSDSDLSSDDEQSKMDYEQLRKELRNQKLIIKELNDELKKRLLIKQTDVDVAQKDASLPSSGYVSESTPALPRLAIPPPPLPNHSSELFAESGGQCPPSRDFLAQIRAVAQSRGVEEDVFGEDILSSENSSDTEYDE